MAERSSGAARAIRLDALIAGPLAGDEIHEALPTAPGVEPKTAATLVTLVNVSMFRRHNELAAYTGLVPCNRQSGTSLNSSSPSRGDNGTLEIPPICSCTSLVGTENHYRLHCETCRARGMRHSKASKRWRANA